MTRKLIIHDGRSEREFVLVGTTTVGRDPSCHISDLDPLLSRRHAHFVTTAAGCSVTDLNSRNGMLVNGVKVREQRLNQGDLVQLGHLQLRYTEDHTAETPEQAAKAHAATTLEAVTRAVVTSSLEDTKPHPPRGHASGHDDDEATRALGARDHGKPTLDPDATVAPHGQGDPNATFVGGVTPGLSDTAIRIAEPDARLTATDDLRVVTASPACRALFGLPPEALVGRPLGDVLAERLKAASSASPAGLTIVVERAAADRSLIVTLKATQAVETVS